MEKIIMCLFLCLTPSIFWSHNLSPEINAQTLGILTLIPPVLSICLAFKTKQVYFSLFLGIWVGALLLSSVSGWSIHTLYLSFEKVTSVILDVISNRSNASIIAQLFTIGGLIAIISKNGGAFAVANAIAKYAKTPRSAQFFTSFIALFMFFDDYANCLITGPVMQPVVDKLRVSREKLAFLVDATAAPISGISLISTWIGYELSILKNAYELAGVSNPNTYLIFMNTIPYRFYNFFMLGFIIMIAYLNKDFGPMLKAEQQARKKNLQPLSNEQFSGLSLEPEPDIIHYISNAFIPILVLVCGTFFGIWYDGHNFLITQENPISLSGYEYIIAILSNTDVITIIFKSAVLASIAAMILSASTNTLSLFKSINTWLSGAQNLFDTVVILVLAWSISAIIGELGTNTFLIQMLRGNIPASFLPILTFILASIISFSTGSAFGTMAILMPLSVPLAATLSGSPDSLITIITTSTILTGAIVGDHCSPISDTTILSAGGSGCSLINHVTTQLPYAIVVSLVSIVCGYFLMILNIPVGMCYFIGFFILLGIILCFGKNPEY